MAIIKLVEKEEAQGKVAEIYDAMLNSMGFIPEAFKLFSPSPYLLETQVGTLQHFSRHENLSGKLLALIRLLVSEIESCKYCIDTNTGILFQYGILPEQLSVIKNDPAKAPLDEKELALLLFVLKVVKNPLATNQSDVDSLKKLGWDDTEILEAAFHGTSQVGLDRLLNAFKVQR